MARFNKKSLGTKTENRASGKAYAESPKLELVSLLLTSFANNSFYESAKEQVDRLSSLVSSISDKKFIAKAAIYARTKFGMRSITHALLGELVSNVKGQSWVKNAVAKTIYRVDDMLETMAYYGEKYGRPIPNSLKKGLVIAVTKFDAYQLAKYKGEGKAVKLVDLFNLVHPKPKKDQTDAFKKLIAGDLKSTETWEAKLSESGKVEAETEEEKIALVAKNKNEAWKDLLESGKLGYFALLRNIRNILEQSPESLDLALKRLVDEELIKKSLILPFQFKRAYDAVRMSDTHGQSAKVLGALDKALDISVSNCPEFDGKTLFALDTSGSMAGQPSEIGKLFLATFAKRNPTADLMVFSSTAKYFSVNPNSLLTDIIAQIPNHDGGTNFHSIFTTAGRAYDRIVILSDMQGWMPQGVCEGGAPTETFHQYRATFGIEPHVYSFDLKGYGTLMFPEHRVYCVPGFSEKVFDLMKLLEKDRNALIEEIEKVELS